MPESVIKLIESDAKQILWSTEPTLRTNEEGTEKKSRRYKKLLLPAKDTTLPLPPLVPLGVARLSPSSRYRVLHEATVGPACALGVPCPVGKPGS